MGMNPRIILVAALLLLIVAPSVSALGTKYWEAKLYPEEGSTTQSILLRIRTTGMDPYGATPIYVYVFYDGVPLVQRLGSSYNSATLLYYYYWDITLTVPQTSLATAYGEHEILVLLEEYGVATTGKTLTYTIVDGAPVGSWWDSLSAAQKAQVKGEKGDTGATGAQGVQGEPGADAVVDYGKLVENLDNAKLWDSVPADILAEMKGAKGDTGAAGRDADSTLLYVAIGLGLVNLLLFFSKGFKLGAHK